MPRGTTTEQGYGHQHQQIAARLHRNHVDGTLCIRCHRPMHTNPALNWDSRPLQAAHPIDRPRAIYRDSKADHLEHGQCNNSGLIISAPEEIELDW